MANSPESMPENTVDFRAPPPSPIASGRKSFVANEGVLTDFLEHSLRVPDLVLPDRIFPRQNNIETPPVIDLVSLKDPENDCIVEKILESIAGIGCFQLVNHGIPHEMIHSVPMAAAGIFRLSPEKKAALSRLPDKPYGFEEVHDEDEDEMSAEFVWCRHQGLKLLMEGIWPLGYSNFSEKMESLSLQIEKVASEILHTLWENSIRESTYENDTVQEEDQIGSICCYLFKHSQNVLADKWLSSLRHDVIRMLIRVSDYSHALCLHLCDGSSEFHVYSKKGWVSFCPEKDALVITVGDQIQAWSGGKYKQVIGRPIFKGHNEDGISMAFLCSPKNTSRTKDGSEKTISLGQQAMLAIFFSLLYQFLFYIYKMF